MTYDYGETDAIAVAENVWLNKKDFKKKKHSKMKKQGPNEMTSSEVSEMIISDILTNVSKQSIVVGEKEKEMTSYDDFENKEVVNNEILFINDEDDLEESRSMLQQIHSELMNTNDLWNIPIREKDILFQPYGNDSVICEDESLVNCMVFTQNVQPHDQQKDIELKDEKKIDIISKIRTPSASIYDINLKNDEERLIQRQLYWEEIENSWDKYQLIKIEHDDSEIFSEDKRVNNFWTSLKSLTSKDMVLQNNLPMFLSSAKMIKTSFYLYIVGEKWKKEEIEKAEKSLSIFVEKIKSIKEEFHGQSLPMKFQDLLENVMFKKEKTCRFCSEKFVDMGHSCQFNYATMQCLTVQPNGEKCKTLVNSSNAKLHHNRHSYHGWSNTEEQQCTLIDKNGLLVSNDCKHDHKFERGLYTTKQKQEVKKILSSNSEGIIVRIQSNTLNEFLEISDFVIQSGAKEIASVVSCVHRSCKCYIICISNDFYLPLMNVVSQAMNLTDCEKQIGMAVMQNTNQSKFWVIVVPPTTTLSISQQIDAAKRFIKNVLTAVNKTTIKRKFMVIINASANEEMLLKNKLNNFVNITITKIQENYVVDF